MTRACKAALASENVFAVGRNAHLCKIAVVQKIGRKKIYKHSRFSQRCHRKRWLIKRQSQSQWAAYGPSARSPLRFHNPRTAPCRRFECSQSHSMRHRFFTQLGAHLSERRPHTPPDLSKQRPPEGGFLFSMFPLCLFRKQTCYFP